MPPLSTHRRARRRSRRRLLTFSVCVLVVVALLVGGVTQIGRQSGPFDASVNGSFAAQGGHVGEGVQQHLYHPSAPDEEHAGPGSQDSPGRAGHLDGSGRSGGCGGREPGAPRRARRGTGRVRRRLTERADAVRSIRSSLDGLLGLRPLPVAGSPGAEAEVLATPALVPSTQARIRSWRRASSWPGGSELHDIAPCAAALGRARQAPGIELGRRVRRLAVRSIATEVEAVTPPRHCR